MDRLVARPSPAVGRESGCVVNADAVPSADWESAGTRAARHPEDGRAGRTKTALREAMVALVLEQGYDAVSVEAVVERAAVTRAAFAAHFGTKERLLNAVVDEFAETVAIAFEDADGEIEGGRLSVLLEQARRSHDVLAIIVRGEGDGEPLRRFARRIAEVLAEDFDDELLEAGTTPRADRHLAISMWAAGLTAAVGWFIDAGEGADPAKVAGEVNAIAEHGWAWAAGRGTAST